MNFASIINKYVSSKHDSGIFSDTILNDNQMEFCIVSDVHIANDATSKKKARNDYVFDANGNPLSGEAHTLKRFCDMITISGKHGKFNDNKHMLIMLGDVVNGGECGYFDCYNSYAFKLLRSTLDPWIYSENILYFAGNHDRESKFYSTVSKFPRQCVIETIEYASKKEKIYSKCGILFEHGNKFDFLCNGKTFLGMMGDFASDVAVNLLSPDTEDLLRGRDYYYDHSSENGIRIVPKNATVKSMGSEDRRVANGALKLLSQHPECHTIICGHTHQSPVKVIVSNNGNTLTYINTGKFAKDGFLRVLTEKDDSGKWHLFE